MLMLHGLCLYFLFHINEKSNKISMKKLLEESSIRPCFYKGISHGGLSDYLKQL